MTSSSYRFWRDPLWWCACGAYAFNRFFARTHLGGSFLEGQFNDFWLIPAALPPVLWVESFLRLRTPGAPPSAAEVGFHWAIWSLVAEGIAPLLLSRCVGDWRDVVAYGLGAALSVIWWRRRFFVTT